MNFRVIVLVEDYHNIPLIADSMVGMTLKHCEVGTTITKNGFRYVGLIFEGEKPLETEIKKMLADLNLTLSE